MVYYSLAQSPDIRIPIPGKDSPKARDKAMDKLLEMMEAGELETDLSGGFGPQEFIEVKDDPGIATASEENDAIAQAVQVLSNLATLKLKVQASRTEAMGIREQIDRLFTDELMDEEELSQLKEGFKILKTFAQANLRFREARSQAEHARTVLDQALKSPES